ncbi:hypothetical protein BC937DRAFT_95460 [Endogone sp. FLAS-F59071]|nr:hypothetical protein BC937DRAFT_95460 [Endogone sp. FLAS-F59071]|eukprot:RUS13344.1 hypothetical protein BC937DRAFT_95460 [Endogone sp. FLAS-F59071]
MTQLQIPSFTPPKPFRPPEPFQLQAFCPRPLSSSSPVVFVPSPHPFSFTFRPPNSHVSIKSTRRVLQNEQGLDDPCRGSGVPQLGEGGCMSPACNWLGLRPLFSSLVLGFLPFSANESQTNSHKRPGLVTVTETVTSVVVQNVPSVLVQTVEVNVPQTVQVTIPLQSVTVYAPASSVTIVETLLVPSFVTLYLPTPSLVTYIPTPTPSGVVNGSPLPSGFSDSTTLMNISTLIEATVTTTASPFSQSKKSLVAVLKVS